MITKEMKLQALKQMISSRKTNQMLYKYRGLGSNTEEIFKKHTLWFNHPSEFNDPFDCCANIEKFNSEDFQQYIKTNKFALNLNVNNYNLDFYTPEMLKEDVNIVLNKLAICCFSKNKENILLWSHYGYCHKGLCLEFDILEDPNFFQLLIPVDYVEVMPNYNHFRDKNEIVKKLIQPKSKCWQYEEEIRIVKTETEVEENKGQNFRFNSRALKKVIFGCETLNDEIDKYRNLCKQNGLEHVKFSKMHKKLNGLFELEERQI